MESDDDEDRSEEEEGKDWDVRAPRCCPYPVPGSGMTCALSLRCRFWRRRRSARTRAHTRRCPATVSSASARAQAQRRLRHRTRKPNLVMPPHGQVLAPHIQVSGLEAAAVLHHGPDSSGQVQMWPQCPPLRRGAISLQAAPFHRQVLGAERGARAGGGSGHVAARRGARKVWYLLYLTPILLLRRRWLSFASQTVTTQHLRRLSHTRLCGQPSKST